MYLPLIRFMSGLEYHHRLGSLVFDEIHKVITDSDYRDAFKNFQSLHTVKAVIFGLTGSLPPALYPALCQLTAMTWKVIRTPSSRKELKYKVVRVNSDKEMDRSIVDHLHDAMTSYKSDDRAIVFCRSKKQVSNLAELFKVHPYYAVGDDQDGLKKNKEAMIKWVSGENKVMTSTSILGCGFDYGHIRDVVHRDPSFTMLDQYQEDSRGGRDGSECRATTFVVDKKKYPGPTVPYDLGSKALFESMNDTVRCQRMAPTLYLDGKAVQCISLPGASFCDNCDKAMESFSTTNLPPRSHYPPTGPVAYSPPATTSVPSPPRREPDLFDPSPRVDLRDSLLPVKRKSKSSESFSSAFSSSKRVKVSDAVVSSRYSWVLIYYRS